MGGQTGGNGSALTSFIPLILIILLMYFLMIRPQRKKDKEVQNMRNNIQVGDEIVTIGGICGKVVKTKEDSFIIQVGADKVKFEMKKWAISNVVKASEKHKEADEEGKKKMPKRLSKKAEAPVETPAEEPAPAEAAPEASSEEK